MVSNLPIKNHFNKILACCFLLPFLIFIAILAFEKVYPFGNNSLLYSDLSDQFIGFLSELARIYKGEGNLFYTFHAAGGINFFPTFVHYCSSPLYLLLIFFPEERMIDAVTVIILLEISLSGLTFGYYLGKRFNCLNKPIIVPFAVCYALSGYSIAFYFLFSFQNAIILLPLVCWQIEKIISRDQWCGCVILYFLLIVSNYYCGYMASLFSCFYFLIRIISTDLSISRKEKIRKTGLFLISIILATGLSAFLWLPLFRALKENADLIGQPFPIHHFNFSVFELFPKLFIGIGDGVKANLPYIYCGILPLISGCLFFFSKQIPKKTKIFSGALSIILILSFTDQILNFIWHGFDYPNWFHYRFSFVFSFLLLTCSFEFLLKMHINNLEIILCGVFLIFGLLSFHQIYPDRIKLYQIFINLFFIVVYSLFLLIVNRGKRNRYIPYFLWIFCSIECFLNGILLYKENSVVLADRNSYLDYHRKYADLIDRYSSKIPGDFYRIEKTDRRSMSNDSIELGYNGLSLYTSILNKKFQALTQSLGITSINYWIRYEGSTIFTDSLFGIKVLFSDYALNRDYDEIESFVWSNPYAFPMFFYSDSALNSVGSSAYENPVVFQEAILEGITGETSRFYESVPIQDISLDNLVYSDSEKDQVRVLNPAQPSSITIRFKTSRISPYYLFIPQVIGGYELLINGTSVDIDPYMSNGIQYILNLYPYLKERESSVIQINFHRQDWQEFHLPSIYEFDIDRFSILAKKIQEDAPQVIQTGFNSFKILLNQEASNLILVSSIPFESGWQVFLDGKRIKYDDILSGLLCIKNIPEFAQEIQLKFIPPGFRIGLVISILSIISVLMFGINQYKK
ncbi:MAG TPA: YfhO family protein [Flexilinea sp.]|nr:YfhO family protein [Flexilinea sp.]